MKKGQGTFEYILLLAGVLLIVVLAIVLLRGGLFQGTQANVQRDTCRSALVQSSACYSSTGTWVTTGIVSPVPPACEQFATATPLACTGAFGEKNASGFCCGTQPS